MSSEDSGDNNVSKLSRRQFLGLGAVLGFGLAHDSLKKHPVVKVANALFDASAPILSEPDKDPDFISQLKGPYAKEFDPAKIESFQSGKPLVVTPFFYWYDPETGKHIYNPDKSDAMGDHPVGLGTPEFGYRSTAWLKKEILDMAAAGIDVFMPVYWGLPRKGATENDWSDGGLKNIVAAMQELRAEKPDVRLPKIGMFFDTNDLNQINADGSPVDLTDPKKEKYFVKTPADFWSQVPAEFWACVDKKPIIMTYSPEKVTRYSQSNFDNANRKLAYHFKGINGFWITMGWKGIAEDASYKWGAAYYGLLEADKVLSIGPGFDESHVPDRPLQRIRPRKNGESFEEDWQTAAKNNNCWIYFLETWNEMHEATEICETKEWGRLFIDLTRTWVDKIKHP